jgi:hypothetical protein
VAAEETAARDGGQLCCLLQSTSNDFKGAVTEIRLKACGVGVTDLGAEHGAVAWRGSGEGRTGFSKEYRSTRKIERSKVAEEGCTVIGIEEEAEKGRRAGP